MKIIPEYKFSIGKIIELCNNWPFKRIEKPKPPKQTTADRIRAMSDEEFAKFLYETETQYAPCDLGIEDTWLEWLQQEVE